MGVAAIEEGTEQKWNKISGTFSEMLMRRLCRRVPLPRRRRLSSVPESYGMGKAFPGFEAEESEVDPPIPATELTTLPSGLRVVSQELGAVVEAGSAYGKLAE